jgi:hypothetical protein
MVLALMGYFMFYGGLAYFNSNSSAGSENIAIIDDNELNIFDDIGQEDLANLLALELDENQIYSESEIDFDIELTDTNMDSNLEVNLENTDINTLLELITEEDFQNILKEMSNAEFSS